MVAAFQTVRLKKHCCNKETVQQSQISLLFVLFYVYFYIEKEKSAPEYTDTVGLFLAGVAPEMEILMQRRIYPFLLMVVSLVGILSFQIRQFKRLYEHIKNDKYASLSFTPVVERGNVFEMCHFSVTTGIWLVNGLSTTNGNLAEHHRPHPTTLFQNKLLCPAFPLFFPVVSFLSFDFDASQTVIPSDSPMDHVRRSVSFYTNLQGS